MKSNTLKKVSYLAIVGLMLMATHSFGQRGNRNNMGNMTNNYYQNIPNLTENQENQIKDLHSAHLEEMQLFRQERRSTVSMDEKTNIRGEMLKSQEEHRNEIRALLTKEQKEYIDSNCQQRYNKSDRGKGSRGKGNRSRNW